MEPKIILAEISSRHLPEAVPFAVMAPGSDSAGPLPLCVFLMGGGGSRQSLIDCRPLFERWWAEGLMPGMVLATPSAGVSYYLEDPAGGVCWESFIREEFIPHLRTTCNAGHGRSSTAITGISMGGYGALKMAFAHPEEFAAVAAMNPMIEPGYEDSQIGPRNRLHHSAGGPARLIGAARDPELFAANNPLKRARANAARIRESGLPIFIEAGDNDFVNAHDGTEFLHRVLWGLDISHDYHLVRGGDHGGPTFRPRMRAMFSWLGSVLAERSSAELTPEEQALNAMRGQLQPLRDQAAMVDPTAKRRFGILPDGAVR